MYKIQPLTWTEFKSLLSTKKLLLQCTERRDTYYLFMVDGQIFYEYYIQKTDPKNDEQEDYEDNYSSIVNRSTEFLLTTDNRLIVKPNVRPIGTTGYFTAVGDNPSVPSDIGGGTDFITYHHEIGQSTVAEIEQKFNVELNRSWVFEGYLHFQDCNFDRFSFYIKPVITTISEGVNTNFKKYGPLIIPTSGDGTVSIDTNNLTTLVSVVPKTDTGLYPSAYWDATFNSTTGKYENLTPNLTGTGRYSIFWTDYTIKRYINQIPLLGSREIHFETTDPSELGSNLRCIYKFETIGTDHEWKAAVFISMYRTKGA